MEGKNTTKTKRYTVQADVTANGIPIYVVIDKTNGHWEAVRGCLLWAEHKAEELNRQAAGDTEWGGKIRQK